MVWRASAFVAFWVMCCAYWIGTPFGERFSNKSALVAIGIAGFSAALAFLKRSFWPDNQRDGFHNDLNWITFVAAILAVIVLGDFPFED